MLKDNWVEAQLRTKIAGHAPEDLARQSLYGFLGRVLARPATAAELDVMPALAEGDAPLNRAMAAFLAALAETPEGEVRNRYHDLFIGVGRGELLPYGSYYLTGFLNEKPLAELRISLKRLGFARADGVHEPEDHIAALCDVMAQLIAASPGSCAGIFDQDKFFDQHLRPWAGQFFADLAGAKSAGLYRHVGEIGQNFMAIEEAGFSMIERA